MKLNSKGPYPSSDREIKFRRCLITFSMKREIRKFLEEIHQASEGLGEGDFQVLIKMADSTVIETVSIIKTFVLSLRLRFEKN